ncbi:nucleotidyltransferase [Elizabethkingia meningoseptica]|uniref:nucleotidyltransferase n=1 Tax=Elizabethkingia meningoseptica TaxID=238 RepID=UPI0023AF44E8|nr:nucleotidyltransferase [Elizabethkingia meningoseptica]MDE5525704.1 nucleotidyltransferase [Elizabethkingia meningoseptica]
MRTIDEILSQMLAEKERQEALNGLTSTSRTAIWRLLFYIVAFAIYTHEQIFGVHKAELAELLKQEKVHTLLWYRNKAKDFQYAFPLLPDSDQFDNTGKTEEEIEASKIIKYAAISEDSEESRLILKVATENAGKLSPITESEQESFKQYVKEYRDAGVKITVINYLPDILTLNIKIYRDSKVLDENGYHKLRGNQPVNEAINDFMKELPFNGELMLNKLIDKLQKVEGVVDPWLYNVESKWIDGATGGYGDPIPIMQQKIPESGYFEVDWAKTIIKYEVKNVV